MKPIFDNQEIKDCLLQTLNDAKQSLDIAMAWFTDWGLFAALEDAANRGVKVRLLLTEDTINRNANNDWDSLAAMPTVRLYWYAEEKATMHHKFCIADQMFCAFGSYNWTYSAATKNVENIVIGEDAKMAKDFIAQLEQLLHSPFTNPHLDYGEQTQAIIEPTTSLGGNMDIERTKMDILLLQADIAQLEEEKMGLEAQILQHESILHREVGHLILKNIELKTILAEAKAVLTAKKVYTEEAKQHQAHRAKMEEDIAQGIKFERNALSENVAEMMKKMYKETIFKIHPDRFQNEPDKLGIVQELTQQLIEAYKKNDFETVKIIWERVQKGFIFVDDLLKSSDLEMLRNFWTKLIQQRDTILAEISILKKHYIIEALADFAEFQVYIQQTKIQLELNNAILETEIKNITNS
jgi:HKD family nuclease